MRPARRTLTGLVVVLALACLGAAGPAGARGAGFEAGAGVSDVTPPPVGSHEPTAFAHCPPGLDGRRQFAFQEPYKDVLGSGHYDGPTAGDPQKGVAPFPGDPYCDANANGRYDQIFTSGATIGSPLAATGVHDPIDARAIAISDGTHVDVIVTVVAQGLFDAPYISDMVNQAKQMAPSITDMIVSANHNESSPDTLGIYGGPAPCVAPSLKLGGMSVGQCSPAGLRSGIDDYYMDYLDTQVARAAAAAAKSLRPATLVARQFPIPANLGVHLSDNWPTTNNGENKPVAIDPKIGLLQARDAGGHPIFTTMSLAAHNQEIGHAGTSQLSADWPGYFNAALERQVGGMAMFLVGDNGSEEDPCTQGFLCPHAPDGSYAQAQATGAGYAAAMAAQAPLAQPLRAGPLRYVRSDFCVPLENNLFKAAAVAGLFGKRITYVNRGGTCVPTGATAPPGAPVGGPVASGAPDSLMTTVSLLDVGPDLQLIDNPGESFPALVLGSPWTQGDVPAECQGRENPPTPTWRAHALYRFQVGLANDMIGYEIPPWAYLSQAGALATSDPNCNTGASGSPDSKGHSHKLETEGVGPTASDTVAKNLTTMVTADAPDPSVHVAPGRYVKSDGSYSQFPQGAVGILLAAAGSSALDPGAGMLIGAPTSAGFGSRAVNATGVFMDYDGQPQAAADLSTRGMLLLDVSGCVVGRYYLDEFPALALARRLGAQVTQPAVAPDESCLARTSTNVAGLQPAAAEQAGLPVAPGATCASRRPPTSSVARRHVTVRHGRLTLSGRARAYACAGHRTGVARVTVSILRRNARRDPSHCRYVGSTGRLGARRPCSDHTVSLLAHGTSRWSLRLRLHIPRGGYTVIVRAVDTHGRVQAGGHRADVLSLRVR